MSHSPAYSDQSPACRKSVKAPCHFIDTGGENVIRCTRIKWKDCMDEIRLSMVDDEPRACETMRTLLAQYPTFTVAGEANSRQEAPSTWSTTRARSLYCKASRKVVTTGLVSLN